MIVKSKRYGMGGFLALLCCWVIGSSSLATGAPVQADPHAGHNHAPGVIHATEGQKRTFEYSADVLDAWAKIPVQEGGRIKPLGTLAGFKLLRYNGRRGINTGEATPEGNLVPIAWFLDCIYFPEQARDYPCMVVNLKDVTFALGLQVDAKKKRDRYSYNELVLARSALMLKAQEASRKENNARNAVDRQLLTLSRNFLELEDLFRVADFAGVALPTQRVKAFEGLFGDTQPELPQLLGRSVEIQSRLAAGMGANGPDGGPDPELSSLDNVLKQLSSRNYGGLAIFPPTRSKELKPEWYSWPDLVEASLNGDPDALDNVPALESLGATFHARQDGVQFAKEAIHTASLIQDRARSRGEFDRIPMEIDFYHYDFFYRALYLFVLGFLLTAIAWLRATKPGGGSIATRGAWIMNGLGLAVLLAGITYRCILRQRPPISTLYETILFIAATAVIVALFLEWVSRNRVGLGLAGFIGAFGMFLANKYELQEASTAGDTMPSLVAVLDTNFWLSVHVTTINMGYASGILAAFLGHTWIFSAFFGKGQGNPAARKDLSRMIYGVLCFSLLFSVVGTILGGVWANDSWGRFWGWDPKENGALLICLWELIILHSRMGGFIRDFGFAIMNVLLAVVVAFSWWGVNLLGVGLHSYGFTEGVGKWLTIFYAVEFSVVLIAVLLKYTKGFGDNKPQLT